MVGNQELLLMSLGSESDWEMCGDASKLLANLGQKKCATFTVHVDENSFDSRDS